MLNLLGCLLKKCSSEVFFCGFEKNTIAQKNNTRIKQYNRVWFE